MNIEELKKQICEYHYGYQFKWDELQDHIKISLLEEIVQKLLTEQKLNKHGVSGKRQHDELIEAIATQTQIIENLISGKRVVNLDEAIAYYKSLHAACAHAKGW